MRDQTRAEPGSRPEESRRSAATPRALLAGIAGALVAAQVIGTTAAAAELEEILVTAQKREQSIQDVGIAITALTGAQLDRLGLSDSTAIGRMLPGVYLGGSSGNQTVQFTIRGVAQNDFADHTESPIAVYVDDTYVIMSQAQRFAMFDLDRVEVLRGPQGTLFGRNATGGLVQFVTRKPTRKLEGYLQAEYGDFDKTRVEGAIGGPLTESISARLSGLFDYHGSMLENDYSASNPESFLPSVALQQYGGGQDLGRDQNVALRAQVLFDLSDHGHLWLSANWADEKMSSPPYQSEATAAVIDAQGRLRNEIHMPADSVAQAFSYETGAPIISGLFGPYPRPVPGGDITGYRDPDGRGWDHAAADFAFNDLNRMKTRGLTAKFDWQFSGARLTSVSDYKKYEKKLGLDIDSAPMNQTDGFHVSNIWQASEELRLDGETERTRWQAGLYFLHADYDYSYGFKLLDNSTALLPPGTFPADYPAQIEQTVDNYSVFGQLEFDLTDKWTLITGLRAMREKKDFNYGLYVRALPADPRDAFTGPVIGLFSDLAGLPVPTATKQDSNDPLWAGKVQLDWRPMDGLLVYAGVNRGVKAGGFNAPGDFGATQQRPGFKYQYDEEVLLAYEGGFKATLFGGTTRLNGSVYYYDYSDYQGFLFSGIGGTVVNNDAKVTGGELELTTSPVDALNLSAYVAVTDATVKDVEVDQGIFLDREPAFTPPLQFGALARYAWPVFQGELALQGDVSYTDRIYYSLRNYDSHKLDSYWLSNVRLSWTSGDGAWEIAGLVNNVTNEVYGTVGFGVSLFCGCSEIGVGNPRWWGLQVRRSF